MVCNKSIRNRKITSSDSTSSGSVRTNPDNSTTNSLQYISISIDVPNSWLKSLDDDFVWNFYAYSNKMDELLKKVPTIMPVKIYHYLKDKRK